MQTDASRGTFNDVIRKSKPSIAAICQRLRNLIADVFPDVVEVPRPAEQHAGYGVGAGKKMNDIFGYICPMRDYVRLGFYWGGALPDPKGLLEGTGKRLRHVKLYTISDVLRPEVRALLKAAVRERKKALGIE